MNCMCAIYQKFYSSLKNLDSVSIKNDFFDNISYLDSFFNEFRSITFTLQSSFKHDKAAMKNYDILKDKYLLSDNMKWCNETRVDVTHKKPFQLNKIVDVDTYYINESKTEIHHNFDLAINDMSLKEITKEIINNFSQIITNEPEIYFTINCSFLDGKENINIFDNINDILLNMNNFLIEFDKDIKYECKNCELIKSKINNMLNRALVKGNELQRDGVFDVKSKKIKFGSSAILSFGNQDNIILKNPKVPIRDNPLLKGKTFEELFFLFISNHIFLYFFQQKHIMPTFFIFFEDNTFTIKSFLFTNKATMYKQINEIASNIIKEKITAVFFVNEMYGYKEYNEETTKLPYEERIKHSDVEYLSFSMLTNKLQEKFYLIDTNNFTDKKSIINIMSNLKDYETDLIITFLNPIKNVFQKENETNMH